VTKQVANALTFWWVAKIQFLPSQLQTT